VPLIGTFFLVDLAYFSANALKVPEGGWFPLGVASLSFLVLMTWQRGRSLLFAEIARQVVPLQVVLDSADSINHVEGTAIFMTAPNEGAPSALLHNIKHNQVLHQRNIMLTVKVEDKPYVTPGNRLLVDELGHNFFRVRVFYGFMDTPDIPAALELCERFNLKIDMMTTSFFVSRAMIGASANSSMMKWRLKLFIALSRNAMNAAEFFKIPTNRVIEMGTRVEI